jgi:penicillin-binding protein A
VQAAHAFGFGGRSKITAAKPSTISAASDLREDLAVEAAAIGQERDLATPLQMATVAATIATDGRRARPRIATIDPLVRRRVVSQKTARQVRSMMMDVVRSGTGTAAALPGVQVAGKTGTAELRPNSEDPKDADAWFVAFAPARPSSGPTMVGFDVTDLDRPPIVRAARLRRGPRSAVRRRAGGCGCGAWLGRSARG